MSKIVSQKNALKNNIRGEKPRETQCVKFWYLVKNKKSNYKKVDFVYIAKNFNTSLCVSFMFSMNLVSRYAFIILTIYSSSILLINESVCSNDNCEYIPEGFFNIIPSVVNQIVLLYSVVFCLLL